MFLLLKDHGVGLVSNTLISSDLEIKLEPYLHELLANNDDDSVSSLIQIVEKIPQGIKDNEALKHLLHALPEEQSIRSLISSSLFVSSKSRSSLTNSLVGCIKQLQDGLNSLSNLDPDNKLNGLKSMVEVLYPEDPSRVIKSSKKVIAVPTGSITLVDDELTAPSQTDMVPLLGKP